MTFGHAGCRLRRDRQAAPRQGVGFTRGSQEAAPAVAAIMSLVESCRRMGINARTYLDDVLPQLASTHPDKVAELARTLTPIRWQAAHPSAATQV